MRRKIAKRKRREALRRGATFVYERPIREVGWRRKDCGFGVEFCYKTHRASCCDDDELETYKGVLEALDMLDECDREEANDT